VIESIKPALVGAACAWNEIWKPRCVTGGGSSEPTPDAPAEALLLPLRDTGARNSIGRIDEIASKERTA
jgi:hypothetical protein